MASDSQMRELTQIKYIAGFMYMKYLFLFIFRVITM